MSSTVEECVYSALSSSIALAAVVSTRISPEARPASYGLPAVVYTVGSSTMTRQLSGRAGMELADVSVTVLSETVAGVEVAAEAIRVALDSVSATLDGTDYSSQLTDEDSAHEMPIDGDDFGIYEKSLNFRVYRTL